jgi:3-hydroxyisobutyrate dehydrogenase
MAKVAFIGLGRMGGPMASRVLAAGHSLTVFNRTPLRAEPLARLGARVAATPADACVGADAVVSMVSDDSASRAVWMGPEGILTRTAQLAPGAFAIECSTLSHDWVEELASAAAKSGLRYIDAPVTGMPGSAPTLLVGARSEDLEAARPLLAAFSERIIRFGPPGAGTAYKLIINLLGAVQIASAGETMALAERAGLDPSTVAEAIASGQAASPQVVRNTRRMAIGQHDSDILFTARLRLKDAEYALRLADKLGIGSPFGVLATRAYRLLCESGYGDANDSSVIEAARRAGRNEPT